MQPSQYGYEKLQHRFAVTSESPSIWIIFEYMNFDSNDGTPVDNILIYTPVKFVYR